jgi:hypothetical protein
MTFFPNMEIVAEVRLSETPGSTVFPIFDKK